MIYYFQNNRKKSLKDIDSINQKDKYDNVFNESRLMKNKMINQNKQK